MSVCVADWSSLIHLALYTSMGFGACLSLTNHTIQPTLRPVNATACPARYTTSPGSPASWWELQLKAHFQPKILHFPDDSVIYPDSTFLQFQHLLADAVVKPNQLALNWLMHVPVDMVA